MCAYFGLTCAGYGKNIFFDSRNPEAKIRFRRPLLTEEERERMSQWLVSSAPPKSTFQLLSQIDDECESSAPLRDFQLSLGPFGVFKVHQDHAVQNATPDETESLPLVEDFENPGTGSPEQDELPMMGSFTVDVGFSQLSPSFMQSLLEPPDHAPSSSSPDLIDLLMDQSHVGDTTLTPHQEYSPTRLISQSYCNPPIQPDFLAPGPDMSCSVPQDAVFLIKHYSSTVISLMTPVRHKKTPWHILFIPHAKDCLAALALGEDMSHASLCNFYGTLAISAFSLGGVSRSESWLEKGEMYLQKAQTHARLMLLTAYDIPKPAKYKSILMAILTMVQVSTFSGNRDQAEGYFLEAEKFIRMKGLKRKKSRKVRLLHHCYVFERMFHESIFVCAANSNHRQHIRRAIESSGLAPASVDGLSFRLYKWKNLHQEMLRVRDREEGENDLHLERPGLFSATLYPEIFGIPEAWLLLLSCVIRLGTEKDAAEESSTPNGLNLKDFISRAKALEDYINQLQRPNQATFTFSSQHSTIDQHILENMLEAMRLALAIYFYRRIYDINASILQEKVIGVRDCLLQCEYADSSVVHGSAGFIWPAFIAACEAEDPDVQESFARWFEISAQRSGLSGFTRTLSSIRKIWQEKRGGGCSVTWLDLMRKALPMQEHGEWEG
jgi:CRISPR/Cas system-associated endoribonuclease Cas2